MLRGPVSEHIGTIVGKAAQQKAAEDALHALTKELGKYQPAELEQMIPIIKCTDLTAAQKDYILSAIDEHLPKEEPLVRSGRHK